MHLHKLMATSLAATTLGSAQNNSTVATYTNPVLWEDLADLDVFRVNDTYYYSADSFMLSPGAPILRSYDLVSWEFIGHSVPTLDFGDVEAYSLEDGQQAYVRGIWASSMRYRPSNGRFYWIGCVDFNQSYVYSASDPAGEWTQTGQMDTCYYDCGLLFDDDDTPYVAYGNTNISIATLNSDLTAEVSTTSIFNGTFYIEGSRLYNINGTYYVLNTQPASREWTLKSTSGIFGPYEQEIFADRPPSPTPGDGYPHQGGIVDTPDGDWYYMPFIDDYPAGRVPALVPMYFDSDGWPRLYSNDSVAVTNAYPTAPVYLPTDTLYGFDNFSGPLLGPQWEWNHNPNTSAYSFAEDGGLILDTATVTSDLFRARNTLTHRTLGPESYATIELDISKMQPGDKAGLALFRDSMAYIGIQDGIVCLQRNLSLGAGWETLSDGFEEASVAIPNATAPAGYGDSSNQSVWLRLHANVAPASDKLGTFFYSFDGHDFTQLGTGYEMNTTYFFFLGYRYGIFNFATEELGGSVTVKSFDMVPGSP
ncbi:hypothetical protein LTR10_005121 [Elasticomyces elasticus]|uniref:Beta-xylosidase C-terminal Concanavalin A-like domain-containing protein n=1 Tax=Elasticomyces elasticus TaxID=574655 RepID=A0AAN7VYM7_9PEZI|nr:hypothetical protein LTR10_005121 [Elasticomyces elasticus]KAK4975861.1 hypothetical protein LTR42_003482 [Elasticomyces elasticus]KAK5691491.1 hypothetical protein LTR97_011484 [Elasticomyces elasticus]